MVQFSDRKLLMSLIAGGLVQLGVAAKNSSEQASGLPGALPNLGKLLFVGGWILTAYAIAGMKRNRKSLLAYGGAVTVLVVVMQMKKLMAEKKKIGAHLPLGFIAGWMMVAYSIAGTSFGRRGQLAYAAVGLVLLSMMGVLPWQRKNCAVDGPGMNMFNMAWVLLAAANSLRN